MTAQQQSSNTDTIADSVRLMRTLADPTRLRLLGLLQGGEMNVTALCEQLDLAQPTVSHHLGLLRTEKLVHNRRAGKQVFYSLNEETITSLDNGGGMTIRTGPAEVRFCDPVEHREPIPDSPEVEVVTTSCSPV
jgi:DNA-binding transcriptional ArsR family regulator